VRLSGRLARRDDAQAASCKEEQRRQPARQTFNRTRSALTRRVIAAEADIVRIVNTLLSDISGQLRFPGL
jgi:hypothetical protein